MGIVEEIIIAAKTQLDILLLGYSELAYQYLLQNNNERGLSKGYGFTAGAASFVEGRAMGFTTMNHTFILTLVDDFQNKDSDEAARNTLMKMYETSQNALKQLQKSKLALPTPTNQVLLISGLAFEDPDINAVNSTVTLRLNFNIQYKYRNV